MKKYILAAGLALGSVGIITTTTQSCMTIATTVGLSVLKKILIGGVSKGLGIFKDKNSFLGNELINAALPQQLKDINSTLEKLGLSNLVQKEKGYIAEAAAFVAPIAEPILINAINDMTSAEAQQIAQGGSGAATAYLKQKTSAQLMAAIAPKVDAKLNEYGIVRSVNLALQGNNLLGGLLGNQNSNSSASLSLSNLAAEQMVNGLFNIVEKENITEREFCFKQQHFKTVLNIFYKILDAYNTPPPLPSQFSFFPSSSYSTPQNFPMLNFFWPQQQQFFE